MIFESLDPSIVSDSFSLLERINCPRFIMTSDTCNSCIYNSINSNDLATSKLPVSTNVSHAKDGSGHGSDRLRRTLDLPVVARAR
jgi:hypothetical protein